VLLEMKLHHCVLAVLAAFQASLLHHVLLLLKYLRPCRKAWASRWLVLQAWNQQESRSLRADSVPKQVAAAVAVADLAAGTLVETLSGHLQLGVRCAIVVTVSGNH